MPENQIIPCSRQPEWENTIADYAEALSRAAPNIGNHGFSHAEFEESGLFASAVERIRGRQAATTRQKYAFVEAVLGHLHTRGLIVSYRFVGGNERHDFDIELSEGRKCCIEAKGCLDGNNTTIFQRPRGADEFIIWSLCQNPGSDPRKNAWSGIHTRLSAEIVAEKKQVDGLIIWDMLCGTMARPCPKVRLGSSPPRSLRGKVVPPPCIYLFPKSVPDPRDNPLPRPTRLGEVAFLKILAEEFGTAEADAVDVQIGVRMLGATIQRQTTFRSRDTVLGQSKWTDVRRAR